MANNFRQNEKIDFEIESDPARVRKFVAVGFGSIMTIALVCAGLLYVSKGSGMTSAGQEEAGWRMPSLMGIMVSAQSGGRVNPNQWDNMMGEMCSQMAGVQGMMNDRDDSSSRTAVRQAQSRCRGGKF